jgi:hypothetical protein
MDLTTLITLLSLITGGIALDGYMNPRTLVVHLVHDGAHPGAGHTTDFVAGTVNFEIGQMTAVRSLFARPRIDPPDKKGFVGAFGDVTGTTAIFDVIESTFQSTPNTITFGVFNDSGKFKVHVYGVAAHAAGANARFEVTVTQADGESAVDTLERATVMGAAQIDPYLAMLYELAELDRTGHAHNAAEALAIFQTAKSDILPSTESLLLARLQNLQGLVYLIRGQLDLASAAFASALGYVPRGSNDPTPVILQLNKAFVDVARNDPDSAAAELAQVTAATNNFQNLLGAKFLSSEGVAYSLTPADVDSLQDAHDIISAYVALRRNNMGEAEAIAKSVLLTNPRRANTVALLADIEGMRGNQVDERALRNSAVRVSYAANPFLEIVLMHARLSFTKDTVSVQPSQYILR